MNLGKRLWAMIQPIQGYAYISDAVEDMTDDEAIQIAMASLERHKQAVSALRQFVRKELKP